MLVFGATNSTDGLRPLPRVPTLDKPMHLFKATSAHRHTLTRGRGDTQQRTCRDKHAIAHCDLSSRILTISLSAQHDACDLCISEPSRRYHLVRWGTLAEGIGTSLEVALRQRRCQNPLPPIPHCASHNIGVWILHWVTHIATCTRAKRLGIARRYPVASAEHFVHHGARSRIWTAPVCTATPLPSTSF